MSNLKPPKNVTFRIKSVKIIQACLNVIMGNGDNNDENGTDDD